MMGLGDLDTAITNTIERISENMPMKTIHGRAFVKSGNYEMALSLLGVW